MAKRRTPANGDESEQLVVLRAIWNEMKALGKNLGDRIDQTNSRLDQTNSRLDDAINRLGRVEGAVHELKDGTNELRRRLVESEMRLATSTTQLHGDVQELSALIRDWRAENASERGELRGRVDRIERHLGMDSKS